MIKDKYMEVLSMTYGMREIDRYVELIRRVTDFVPEVGLILGSGLGDYADGIQNPICIPYGELPGFPVSTAPGHKGQFVMGVHKGKRVIAMQGRIHGYEGYDHSQLALPVRIMRRLGAESLFLTNAAGGINTAFAVGALMIITDHINYSGQNPLTGQNLDELGPRFPDMSDLYSKTLRETLKVKAAAAGIPVEEGVYVMFAGPSYETPAEIRMARGFGADAVGMSTVPEAIAARHCGMRVLGVSCITNCAAGILDTPLSHAEVVETTARVKAQFIRLVDLALEQVL
jgi:purine-nucleoside phosphorylase